MKLKARKRHTPLASRYRAGRAYEYACKKKLEAEGWTVLRTAGSHGDADLVCYLRLDGLIGDFKKHVTDDPRVLLIQCKLSPTKADREKIDRLRRETGLDWRLM